MSTLPSTGSEWPSGPKFAAAIAILLGVVAMLVVFYVQETAEQSAVQGMPEGERRVLFERTLRTLEEACEPPDRRNGLDEYCRQQANFLAKFPECDAACRVLLEGQRDRPTR